MKTYASLPNQEPDDGNDTSAPKNYSENLKGLNRKKYTHYFRMKFFFLKKRLYLLSFKSLNLK
jgi:hypothetical protein